MVLITSLKKLKDMNLTEETHNDFLKEKEVTLVDYYASWCGPCKILAPIIDNLSNDTELKDNVSVGKVDVEEQFRLSSDLNIMNLPTVIIYKNGEEKERLIGLQSPDIYKDKIKYYLN